MAEINGSLPARARGLTIEWAQLHQDELRLAWTKAHQLEIPNKIDPLQ